MRRADNQGSIAMIVAQTITSGMMGKTHDETRSLESHHYLQKCSFTRNAIF